MIGPVHHYGVTVSDLEESIRFYCDTFGLEEPNRFSNEGERISRAVGVDDVKLSVAFLTADGCDIELIEYERPPGENANDGVASNDVGSAHVCFEVDDLESTYERLADEVAFVSPPQRLETGVAIAYLTDPDGNTIELLERGPDRR